MPRLAEKRWHLQPLLQADAKAALASTDKKCPLPTDICSANVASRAQVTFPWNHGL